MKDTPLRQAKNSLKVQSAKLDENLIGINNSEFSIGNYHDECIAVLSFLLTFLILFAAFIQFLSRSCPLPFLQIPSPIHSQKLIHNQEEEEDQPQATPPSGTHVQMCQALFAFVKR